MKITSNITIKTAYGSYATTLGIILAAVSSFNFLHSLLNFELSKFFELCFYTYRVLFHGIFDFLTARLFSYFDIKVVLWVKDLAVLYFLVGSALFRAIFPAFRHRMCASRCVLNRPKGMISDAIISSLNIRYRKMGRKNLFLYYSFFMFIIILIWPLLVSDILKDPIFMYIKSEKISGSGYDRYHHVVSKKQYKNWKKHGKSDGVYFNYDINRVLFAQLCGVALLLLLAIVFNFKMKM